MRTVAVYERIPHAFDGVHPYQTVHDLPDAGIRVIVFFDYQPKPPAIWDTDSGEVLDDVPF